MHAADIAHLQVPTILELPIPANQRVLRCLAQLPNGRFKPLSELDVELDNSNSLFV
jgi:hypothetical protein